MKRKLLITLRVLLVLALLAGGYYVFRLWQLIPVFQDLQQEHLPGSIQLGEPLVADATPVVLPAPGPDGPQPLIFDDDGSPDGMIALLYFLANPLFDLRAVTISYGEAHPAVFAPQAAQLLAGLGRGEVAVGAGSETPLAGSNAFPDAWRSNSDAFWGLDLPEGGTPQTPLPAAQLIVATIHASPRPVTIFLSGAHTNLAEALQIDPTIAANIAAVYIMGGSVYAPGNINSAWPVNPNETAEWNLYVDPLAAQQVFASGLPLHLVPLDATDRVEWTKADLSAWQASSSAAGRMAAEMLDWILRTWPPPHSIWDLTAALQATDPPACPETPLALEVVTEPGPDEGRTRPVENVSNIQVCLEPDAARFRGLAAAVLGR